MFNILNIKKNVLKTIMPTNVEGGLDKFAVAGGIIIATYMWTQYTDPIIKYASNQLGKLIESTKHYLPTAIGHHYSPDSLVGVTLASQIFINSKTTHPPVIQFAKNTIIGLSYYVPYSIVSEVTKSLFFAKNDNFYSFTFHSLAGVLASGFVGSFTQVHATKTIDKLAQNLGGLYHSSILITGMISTSLFGKAKADALDDMTETFDVNIINQQDELLNTGVCNVDEQNICMIA